MNYHYNLQPPCADQNKQPGHNNLPYFKNLVEEVCSKRHLPVTQPIGFNDSDMTRLNDKLKELFSQHNLTVYPFDSIEQISNLYTGRMHDLNFKPILK